MTNETAPLTEGVCLACVFFPPNLPASAYSAADWEELRSMACSLEHAPASEGCLASRKTSCSLVGSDRG